MTRDGWLYERDLLRQFLDEHKDPAQVRAENKERLDSGKRDFKIASRDGLPKIAHTTWKRTILDVRLLDANSYCQDISAWAGAVLEEARTCEVL